jgi:hypothetical protein
VGVGLGAGVGVGVGVGVGAGLGAGVVPVGVVDPDEPEPDVVVVPELDDPDELPVNCVVVVPADCVRAFVPPHPVIESAATARDPMATKPFRFNCIHQPFGRWGSRLSGQLTGASTLDIYGESCRWVKEFTLERKDKFG